MAKNDDQLLESYFSAFTPEQWELRSACLRSPFDFAKNVLGYDKLNERVHGEWEGWFLDESSHGKPRLILIPRGHYKTTFFTVSCVIWLLIKNPDLRILLVNAKWDNARSFLYEIRQQIENNEMLHWVFPETYLWMQLASKWTADAIIVPRKRNVKEPSIATTGVGAHIVSQHYDLIIGDDLVDNENTLTKDQIEKTIIWWKQSLSLLDKYGVSDYWLIGTRWHYADLYGYIKTNLSDEFHIIERRAILADGQPYFPEEYSLDTLERIKRNQGSYIFSCQYMNEPVDEEDAIFKQQWIRYFEAQIKVENRQAYLVFKDPDTSEWLEHPLEIWTAIDPAIGEKDYHDYTAIATIGVDKQTSRVFLIDIFYDKVNPKGQIDACIKTYSKWYSISFGVESVAYQKALKFWLDNYSVQQRIFAPFVETKADYNKVRRIQSIQPIFEAGAMFILASCPHKEDLLYEMTRFPKGEHDDILDALEGALRLSGIIYQDLKPADDLSLTGMDRRIAERLKKIEQKKWKPTAYASADSILGSG